MPTYEYVCTACGHRLEAVQSFSDPALTTCPDCQGVLRKVFGNVGIVLKGSGFYKNDSRSSGGWNGAKPKEPKEKEKESTSSSSKEASKDSSSSSKEASKESPSSPSSTPAPGSSEKAAASSS